AAGRTDGPASDSESASGAELPGFGCIDMGVQILTHRGFAAKVAQPEMGEGACMPTTKINGFALNYEQVGDGTPLVYIAGTRFDSAKMWVPYMERNAGGFHVL